MLNPDLPTPERRATFVLADARLTHVFLRTPERCATVDEYAAAAGMNPEQVLQLLQPHLSSGVLAIELFADTMFVHTAPRGRHNTPGETYVHPNLWERLRSRAPLARAHALWKLIRSLEHAGWNVEANAKNVTAGLGYLPSEPFLGVEVRGRAVAVIPYPAPAELTGEHGACETYLRAGAPGIAITCDNGGLDATVTAVRTWALTRGGPVNFTVLVLEAPRFNPTMIRPSDNSITPIAFSRQEVAGY